MKRVILIVLALISVNAFGQQNFIGAQVGLSLTNITSGYSDYKLGAIGGLNLEHKFIGNYAIEVDLLYSQQGYKDEIMLTDSAGVLLGTIHPKSMNDYLLFPVKLGYYSGKKFVTFVKVGLVPGLLIKSEHTSFRIVDNRVETYTYDSKEDIQSFDLAGMLELGLGVNLDDHLQLFSSISYKHSLTAFPKVTPQSGTQLKHFGYSLSIGLKYSL